MSKVAKWIFPIAGGKDGIIGTATAVVGFMTGNWGMVASGIAQVAGAGKKSQAQARQASILQLSLGETPREAVFGMTATGGSLVDVFNFGGQYGTDKVTRCVALADHAIDGIEGFYVDDVYYPWTNEGQQAVFSNKLSFHFRNATPDGYDPPQHVQQYGGWTATDRMAGVTHIWIDWYVDDKVWPQGHPEIRFVLRGLRVYDARFDPSLGYTGPEPQIWADRSTHKFSRNAKVLRYAYTRGIYAEGHQGDPDYLLIGRGLTADEAPPELVIADANLCDEIVDGLPRYRVDAVVSASQPYIEVDGLFAAAMAGEVIQRQGTVEVEAGQAKAVVVTITDDDLVEGEPVKFSDFLPDNDGGRVNTVIGRYIEPSLGYRDHSAPVRRSLADIQSDKGPREQTISLPFVTDAGQVGRIIEIRRLMSRLEKRASIVLPPKFAGLEEGDWIAWQSKRRHGGATRRYRIETYRQPETWRMYLTLREIASSVFGIPDPVEDTTAPPPPPQVIDALQLFGVEAEPITLAGESSTIPAIRFKWTAPVDAAVQAIRAEVRRDGETEAAPTRTEGVDAGIMVATNGVGPDQVLQCRLVPIGDPSRPVVPSAWISVSTSTIVAGDLSPESPVWTEIELQGVAIGEVTGRLQTVEGISAANAASVADLEEVYGDTVSAAQSALAAGEAANLAALKAQQADGSASASNVSAGVASIKADEAGASASAANASRIAAESAKDGASGSATAAATSASNASTSATNAGQSATAASGSATQAGTSAGQAQTFASQASTSAGNANTAAISAGVSATSAQSVANRLMPDRPERPADFYNANFGAQLPENAPALTEGANLATSDQGVVRRFNGSMPVASRGWRKLEPGRTYRYTAVSRVVTAGVDNVMRNGFIVYNSSAVIVGYWFDFPSRTAAGGWVTDAKSVTTEALASAYSGAAYIRPCFHGGVNNGGGDSGATWDLAVLRCEDVTESAAAAASAAAALTQAANAGSSAAAASISANLAAQAGVGSLNKNPTFADWPTGQSLPNNIGAFGAVNQSRAAGKVSANSIQLEVASGATQCGVEVAWPAANWNGRFPVANGQTAYWVIEYKIEVGTPNLGTASLRFLLTDAATGATASPVVQPLLSSLHTSTGDDQIVQGSYFFACSPNVAATAYSGRLAFFARTAAVANYGRYYVHKLAVRPATAAEIAAQVALPDVQAQLAITAGVAADAQTRLANVIFEVIGASGGDPFQLLFKTVGSSSLGRMVASALQFGTVVGGQIVETMKMIAGEVFIVGPLYLGPNKEIELNPLSTTPHISIKVGAGRMAFGRLPNDNLIYWFGPTQTVANMRKNNATEWRDTTGNAYFGGSLSAGTLKNTAQTSSTAALPETETAVFGSNGGAISVVLSFAYESTGQASGYNPRPSNTSGANTGTVKLYRKVGTGAYVEVATLSPSGAWSQTYTDNGTEPGQPNWYGMFYSVLNGSITFTDNLMTTQNRQYKAVVTAKSAQAFTNITQRLGIIATEG